MSRTRSIIQQLGAKAHRFLLRQNRHMEYSRLLESGRLQIGRSSYGQPRVDVHAGASSKVIIGSFCSISNGVTIIPGGEHPSDWVSTYPFRIKWNLPGGYEDGMPTSKGDVLIGSDVWIGTEAMILSGVHIGHGAIVAARSVVTRDIPPYAIVAGVPARVQRLRFDEETIEKLLDIAWWDWDDGLIREAVPLLSSNNMVEFLRVYEHHTSTEYAT